MSDVGRKVISGLGHLNRPKPLSFNLAQDGVLSSEPERRVRDGVNTERQDDRYGD